ncbi:MAG: aspartate--tRNA ligase [Bacilli bacterium]|jgi:aspartyl-tRNA synthetase|nr:aspartate--tRNA ligase [Erysipelotrichaceae bacterium]
MYRTIENGNINEKLVGQTVKIIGWVAKKRDLGGLTFVDLRDRSGIVQVLINEGVARPDIRNEYIIQIEGVVTLKEVPNKNLKTGKVEVVASKVTLINKAKNPPLIIADETDALEDVRLKYRYLDLRRKVLQDKLIARAKITKVTREFLDNEGFIEIETPILTKSTPGGARDYLIPSRLNPGTFYALAQSPQIYKQLLMIGGLEKYYQIARCFRDEDLRSDRQPDFTQIDIETSFFTYEEVLDLNERLLQKIFKEVKGYDLKLPLPRLTYHEAVENYGSDKPDLRFDLKIRDLSKVLSNEEYFKAKEDVRGLIINDPTNILSRKTLDELNLIVKQHGLNFLGVLKYDGTAFSGSLAKNITSSHTEVAEALGLAANDVVLLGFDAPLARILSALGAVRKELGVRFNLIDENAYSCLWVDSFPLFSYDPETRRFASEHHPFTQPKEEDIAKLTTAPEEVLSYAYDIVINGYEAGGGSMRIYDQDLQNRIFEILGLSEKEIEYLFGFFIEALKYGTPPHGGIAFGLDRLTMILTGTDDIRDVIAFPKNLKGASLMSGEPSKVSNLQLDELYIKINTGKDGGEE